MNPILEESALPTTTSDPDVEPTFVLGTPLSKRLDRMEYEYDDEQSVEGVWEDGSMQTERTMSRDEDAVSIARTFGVKSRAGNSLRQYASFDSSLRQHIPVPASPVGCADSPSSAGGTLPPVPPKSPARNGRRSVSLDEEGSPVAGPSRLPLESLGSRIQGGTGHQAEHAGQDGSETPRSGTPTSSFYASPRRRQQGHVTPRDSSLHHGAGSSEEHNSTPRAERHNPLDGRASDEGFDSRSNSTGPPSLRSHPPVPVDANLRSMPGVVGLGDGWAGGPQNQNKKRKLWFRKKSKAEERADEDPLALWAIQENGADGNASKAAPRKAMFKEAWNRSISKFGSMPALVSGDHLDGAKSSVKQLLSRSRVDLTSKPDPAAHASVEKQDEKKAKRRTVAFFGLSKSQVDVSSPRPAPSTDETPDRTDRWLAQSPPSPTPVHARGFSDSARPRDVSSLTPIAVPPRDARRLSAPLSAPPGPGGLPPPWRPQSFTLPRPQPATPAPRPFSRHEDHEMEHVAEDQEELRVETGDQHPAPPMLEGGSGDPQTSASSASAETPLTGSADERSLKHKQSLLFTSEGDHVDLSESPVTTPVLMRPISSLSRAGAQTPSYTFPHNPNPSTPGLDTLKDWASEGKRPASRIMSRRATASRSKESPMAPPLQTKRSGLSLFDRLKQALAVPETPAPHQAFAPVPSASSRGYGSEMEMEVDKDLPKLPSRTSTPVMPGAYPVDTPQRGAAAPDVDRDLPASPYDITQAVAHQMLASPPPSRPTSRMTVRKRGLSGDMWHRRLSRINEGNDSDVGGSRSSSRQDKRRSVSALAGRFGFTSLRRNSLRGDDASDTMSISSATPAAAVSMPALDALEFGEDDLGLDDILDETRRMSLVRDLEASLPLPPTRHALPSTSPAAQSMTMTISSSEATVLAPAAEIESPVSASGSGSGHRHQASTSTMATVDDRDETVMTPEQMRKSLDTANSGDQRRRGSAQSDDSERDRERVFRRQQWPTRGHHRGASMGSIGELAHDLLNNKPPGTTAIGSKRASVVLDLDGEDDERPVHKVREERTMSIASGISSLSSAMSIDEEEAVPMSAVRIASIQQAKSRQVDLGSSPSGIRV